MNVPIKHFEDFDSMRGIAALSVVLFHISTHFIFPNTPSYSIFLKIISFNENAGIMGVNFFFVLSGFLITYLILREKYETGRLEVLKFYMRRILRIWPLYFLTIIIGFIIYPFLAEILNKSYIEQAHWQFYVVFLTNFNNIIHGFSLGILGVQWSVAIEEQFYLIWPLLFGFIKNKRTFLFISLALVIFSNIFIIHNIIDANYIYFHTFSAINELAFGGIAAFVAFHKPNTIKNILGKFSNLLVITIYVTGLTMVFFNNEISSFSYYYAVIKKPVIALFFVFIVLEQTYSNKSLFKLRKIKFLAFLGKISYGIYLLHMVAIQLILSINAYFVMPALLNVLLSLIMTIFLSQISYKYFESFFLKLKTTFR